MLPNKHKRIQKLAKKVKHIIPETTNAEVKFKFRLAESELTDEEVVVQIEQPLSKVTVTEPIVVPKEQPKEQLKEQQFIRDDRLTMKLSRMRKTVLFPNSILEPVQTIDLENHLIGKLARQFCV